jgi:DNA-binding transcriptional LysR family regulator
MFDWNDLRYFLAVARAGTTLGAAAKLGISQPTVVRRICGLEEACGFALFDRSPSGYALTEGGRSILPIAERAEAEMQAVADFFASRRGEDSGRIRLMLPDSMEEFLFPQLQAFRAAWPGIQVQILTSYRPMDLARGEADISVKVLTPPESDALLARPLPSASWTVYASRGFAEQRPLPATSEDLDSYPLIGSDGDMADFQAFQWLKRVAPNAEIVLRCNLIGGVRTAIRAGIGIAPLPCLLVRDEHDLIPCFPPLDGVRTALWLVTRRELRRLPHVAALYEGLYSYMMTHAHVLTGEAGGKSTDAARKA